MGEEFVAIIKLVSGEEILASVCVDETGEEPIIIVHTPVTMKMINNGMYVKIKPWEIKRRQITSNHVGSRQTASRGVPTPLQAL